MSSLNSFYKKNCNVNGCTACTSVTAHRSCYKAQSGRLNAQRDWAIALRYWEIALRECQMTACHCLLCNARPQLQFHFILYRLLPVYANGCWLTLDLPRYSTPTTERNSRTAYCKPCCISGVAIPLCYGSVEFLSLNFLSFLRFCILYKYDANNAYLLTHLYPITWFRFVQSE